MSVKQLKERKQVEGIFNASGAGKDDRVLDTLFNMKASAEKLELITSDCVTREE